MSFDDIAARFKKANQAPPEEAAAQQRAAHEGLKLRAKMLGVLIRDARLEAARTPDDIARLLGLSPETIESWEYGDAAPSLPQLELMAFYLGVPISHFWGLAAHEYDRAARVARKGDYLLLRDRMIGALLRQARQDRDLTLEDLAQQIGLPPETLEAFESGEQPIPMHLLQLLAGSVNQSVSYFLELSGEVGAVLQDSEALKTYMALDEDMRAFVSNPSNQAFIHIAMMFRNMPTDQLRKLAEGLLEITM